MFDRLRLHLAWRSSSRNGRPASFRENRKPRRLNLDEKRVLAAQTLRKFFDLYGRKAPKRGEPNDRRYDRAMARRVKRMRGDEIDAT